VQAVHHGERVVERGRAEVSQLSERTIQIVNIEALHIQLHLGERSIVAIVILWCAFSFLTSCCTSTTQRAQPHSRTQHTQSPPALLRKQFKPPARLAEQSEAHRRAELEARAHEHVQHKQVHQ